MYFQRHEILVGIFAVGWAFIPRAESAGIEVGPQTEAVEIAHYAQILHVREGEGARAADGSREAPFCSVADALARADGASEKRRIAVIVAAGTYPVRSLALRPFVDLYGGFEPTNWTRDILQQWTILKGEGDGAVVVGADNARIDGFVVTEGRSVTSGGGVLCQRSSPTISNNWIVSNRTLRSPAQIHAATLHQKGNGGGGISCIGASPSIRNNWLAKNSTDFGDGGGLSCSDNSHPRVEANVFFANVSGLNDPQTRSSNGGAVACTHYSRPVICGNVFLENRAAGRGDGGGVYGEYFSHAQIQQNIFVGNSADDDGAAAYFMAAADPLFRGNLLVGNGPGSCVIRLSKNGLGHIEGNTIVGNPTSGILSVGASLVSVNNLICENAGGGIVAEASVLTSCNDTICRQAGCGIAAERGSARILNSLVAANSAGQVRLNTDLLWVQNCLFTGADKDAPTGIAALETTARSDPGRFLVFGDAPTFHDDSLTIQVQIGQYEPGLLATAVVLPGEIPGTAQLTQRPVRIGDKWTVVQSADDRQIFVWGVLREGAGAGDAETCYFPPTYHLTVGSPGIDQGESLGAPAIDIDGELRPGYGHESDRIDIGADEFVARPIE